MTSQNKLRHEKTTSNWRDVLIIEPRRMAEAMQSIGGEPNLYE